MTGDLLRQLFETTVRRCMAEGLVGAKASAVDASLIKADANRQSGTDGAKGLAPEVTSRAVEEYLAVLDDAAFGGATPVVPKYLAPADPASRWTGANGGMAFYAYSTNYLIDLKHAVIVDVEASTAIRQAEVTACKTMIVRAKERFDLHPGRLAADTAYGSAEMLNWLVNDQRIETARAGLRQVRAHRRDPLARRLRLRRGGRRLHLPGWEACCTGDGACSGRQGRKR